MIKFFIDKGADEVKRLSALVTINAKSPWWANGFWVGVRPIPGTKKYELALWLTPAFWGYETKQKTICEISEKEMVLLNVTAVGDTISIDFARQGGGSGIPDGKVTHQVKYASDWSISERRKKSPGIIIVA